MKFFEVNFDGLPGPTHLYGGLGVGNLASSSNKDLISRPKLAALQSLEKIKFIADLGFKQAILPPHPRPEFELLRNFGATKLEMIKNALEQNPELVKSAFSSSFMWTANAATVSPAPDTADAKTKLTIANLKTNYHRSIESFQTYKTLRNIFTNTDIQLKPPMSIQVGDEGAANHVRFAEDYGSPGLELFVYGYSLDYELPEPKLYPARQALEASMDIIESHGLNETNVVLAMQNPEAIDAGVFHNDVISTGNLNFFLYHEFAFANQDQIVSELCEKYQAQTGGKLITRQVLESELPIEEAVSSYLFNSQILGDKDNMILIAPIECEENPRVANLITKLINDPNCPIKKVHFLDLKQSMYNGGGPACLRLRVVMNEEQIKNSRQEVFYSEELYSKLKACIEKNYPDELNFLKLADDKLLEQIEKAYAELNTVFGSVIF